MNYVELAKELKRINDSLARILWVGTDDPKGIEEYCLEKIKKAEKIIVSLKREIEIEEQSLKELKIDLKDEIKEQE